MRHKGLCRDSSRNAWPLFDLSMERLCHWRLTANRLPLPCPIRAGQKLGKNALGFGGLQLPASVFGKEWSRIAIEQAGRWTARPEFGKEGEALGQGVIHLVLDGQAEREDHTGPQS